MGATFAQDQQVIPPGVVYKKASPALNEKIINELRLNFAGGGKLVAKYFSGSCICAPAYWSSIKSVEGYNFKSPIPTNFEIPNLSNGRTQKLVGATLRSPEDLAVLASLFARDVGVSPEIRKLTTSEIRLFWSMIPFDIEEPIFVLRNANKCFLIMLMKDEKSGEYFAFWVDEISAYSISKK
jgi:hypothetical protein